VGLGASLESLETLASTEIRFPDHAAHGSFVQIIQLIQSSLVQWFAACRSLTPEGPQGYSKDLQISHNFAESLLVQPVLGAAVVVTVIDGMWLSAQLL